MISFIKPNNIVYHHSFQHYYDVSKKEIHLGMDICFAEFPHSCFIGIRHISFCLVHVKWTVNFFFYFSYYMIIITCMLHMAYFFVDVALHSSNFNVNRKKLKRLFLKITFNWAQPIMITVSFTIGPLSAHFTVYEGI